jgi:hypothetical protein
MNYAYKLDNRYTRNVGWMASYDGRRGYTHLFEERNIQMIQSKITELLGNVADRPIVVTKEVITSVLSECIDSHRPQVGDMYSRYILPSIELQRNDVREIIDRTINIIVTQIRNEYEITACNKKLTVWNTLLGDFNSQGLRSHAPIKIRKRRSDRMMFNMNY